MRKYVIGSVVAVLVAGTALYARPSGPAQKTVQAPEPVQIAKAEPARIETARMFSVVQAKPLEDLIASKLDSQPVAALAPAVQPKAPVATLQVSKPQTTEKRKSIKKQASKSKQAQQPPRPPKPIVTGSR